MITIIDKGGRAAQIQVDRRLFGMPWKEVTIMELATVTRRRMDPQEDGTWLVPCVDWVIMELEHLEQLQGTDKYMAVEWRALPC